MIFAATERYRNKCAKDTRRDNTINVLFGQFS